jgi:acyl dehydratase
VRLQAANVRSGGCAEGKVSSMHLDVATALTAPAYRQQTSWDDKDVLLYHLGIGAGSAPTDLRYTYENDLQVLPSFVTVIGGGMPGGGLSSRPGFDVDLASILHGSQEIVVHQPLPAYGSVVQSGRVSAVYDKGKAAVVVLEGSGTFPDGTELYTSRNELFVRGEGGFGGDRGPATNIAFPDREPDHTVEKTTRADQALIYRLSGDRNPLHADPDFAKAAGFDAPILHGLCSYGLVLKAVVDACLHGDATRIRRYRTKFAGVLFPGETIRVRVWQDGGGSRFLLRATAIDRHDAPVLSDGLVEYG